MKINWFKLYISIMVMAIVTAGVGSFYWFELRPAKIKHDCSWVKVIDPSIPAKPAITQEEFSPKMKVYTECMSQTAGDPIKSLYCGDKPEEPRPEIPAVTENTHYRKAIKTEYDFCIRDKGL